MHQLKIILSVSSVIAKDCCRGRMSENLSSPAMASVQSLMFAKPLVAGFWPGCLAPDMKEVLCFLCHHHDASPHYTFSISSISVSLSVFSYRYPACATAPPPPSTSATSVASSSSSSSSLSTLATSDPLSWSCWTTLVPTVRSHNTLTSS